MKKRVLVLIVGFLFIGVSGYAADGDLIVNGNVTVGGSLTAPNVLTKYYQSPEQTITSAGALTLAHGLGVEPVLIQVVLICKTAEQGYNVGDKLFANPGREAGYNQGIAVVPDTTNLNIRFGQTGTNVFTGLNKTTGASVNFTNTKWNVIFRAWAF
jgi:type 1 fimbria pilin